MVHVGRTGATHRYGDDAGDDSNLKVSQNAVTQYRTGRRRVEEQSPTTRTHTWHRIWRSNYFRDRRLADGGWGWLTGGARRTGGRERVCILRDAVNGRWAPRANGPMVIGHTLHALFRGVATRTRARRPCEMTQYGNRGLPFVLAIHIERGGKVDLVKSD